MKEVLQLANDFVIKVEDRHVTELWENVELMRRRAKMSHTRVAEQEAIAAEDRVSDELDRLSSPIPDPYES